MSDKEVIYYGPNVEANKKRLQYVHDIMCLCLGTAAGILSLESVYGFLFYVVGISVCNMAFVAICCGGKPREYFRSPVSEVFLEGMQGNVAGFVMMWCLVYELVK